MGAHVEGLNGQQIAVENVMIQYAQIFTAQGVEPDAAGIRCWTPCCGENTVRLFHSGQMFEGVWSKGTTGPRPSTACRTAAPFPSSRGKVGAHRAHGLRYANWS